MRFIATARFSCASFEMLPKLIAPRGIVLLEAAPSNALVLEELVRATLPHAGVETIRDYADLDRYVVAVVPDAAAAVSC